MYKSTFCVKHNDGAYAKLAMGPMWAEILANIEPIIHADDRGPPPNRLALFSGHDTTILPLLISLGPDVWDGEWPPYASMMIIEVRIVGVIFGHCSCTKPLIFSQCMLVIFVDSRTH